MRAVDWETVRARSDRHPWSLYRRATLDLAEHLMSELPPRVDERRHNWVLEQARIVSKYIITLAGAYRLTGETRFASRAWFFVEDVLAWPRWFWLGDPRTQGFALSTGELGITCFLVEDWLGDVLSADQRDCLNRAITDRVFTPYLEVTAPGREVVWFRSTINWNAVCNGAMLALAMQRRSHDAQSAAVIARAVEGLRYYLDRLHPDGSLPESIGYWQYGIIHLAYALLAWERYSGTEHPALAGPALRSGLSFPFDFTPEGGAAVGFGDCNVFLPQGFLFALAARVGRTDVTSELHRRMLRYLHERTPADFKPFEDYHPTEVFNLVYSNEVPGLDWPRPRFKVYPDVGWGVFTSGQMTLGFRAGTTAVSHSMRDLCAVNLARGGVALLDYVENLPYCRGWFNYEIPRGSSRELFFEDNSTSKNTLLANGVGQIARAASTWGLEGEAMWCDSSSAYPWFVRKILRRAETVADGFLLSDEVETDAECWHEARFFTSGHFLQLGNGRVRVVKGEQTAELRIESDLPMNIVLADAVPSVPARPTWQMLRISNRDPVVYSKWKIRIVAGKNV